MVDGVNGCVVGFGESGSGKSFTLNGDGSIPGVTQLMVEGIFTMMREKEKTLAVGGKKNRGKCVGCPLRGCFGVRWGGGV